MGPIDFFGFIGDGLGLVPPALAVVLGRNGLYVPVDSVNEVAVAAFPGGLVYDLSFDVFGKTIMRLVGSVFLIGGAFLSVRASKHFKFKYTKAALTVESSLLPPRL